MKDNDESGFFERVYQVVSQVPYGRVTTYGAIARCCGSPQSARMVGWALNSQKHALAGIPAHRVVNRNGLLTGRRHFPFGNTMQQLLESEGILISDNKVLHFDKVYWKPDGIYF